MLKKSRKVTLIILVLLIVINSLPLFIVTAQENIALGKSAIASSSNGIDTPDKAVDGSTVASSTWRALSGDYIKWWQVDLGGYANLSKIELCPEIGTTYTDIRQNFQILGSNDTNFTTYDILGLQGASPFDINSTFVITNASQGKLYKYIRAVKTVSTENFSIAELRAFGKIYDNIAQGKTVTASGQNGTKAPQYAVDENINNTNYWDAAKVVVPQWIKVDLGAQAKLGRIELYPVTSPDYASTRKNFQIQGSNDAAFSTYDILGAQGSTDFGINNIFVLDSITQDKRYQYIRIIKTVSTESFTLSELKVFGNSTIDVTINATANKGGIAVKLDTPISGLSASDFTLTKNGISATINSVNQVVGSSVYNLDVSGIEVGDTFVLNIVKNGYQFNSDVTFKADFIADIAKNYTNISASATQTGYEFQKALDQNQNTFWNVGGVAGSYHYLQIELPTAQVIKRLELDGYKGTNQSIINTVSYRQSFEVRASNDSSFATYEVLGEQGTTSFDITKPWGVNVASETPYKYVRFQKTTSSGALISEFRVYADAEKYNISFFNAETQIDSLINQWQIKASANIIREAQDNNSYVLKLELWNQNELEDTVLKEVTIDTIGEQTFETDHIILPDDLDLSKYKIKAYLLNEIDDIVPLCSGQIDNTLNISDNVIMASYHISPSGDDINGSGSITAPYKSIERAKEQIRLINKDMSGNIVVYLHGGIYQINSTIEFDKNDSGTNGYQIIYKACENEKPVISGGTSVENWTQVQGTNIWQASVDMDNIRQLYVDGKRQTRAKSSVKVRANGWINDTTVGGSRSVDGFYLKDNVLPSLQRPQDLELHWISEWRDYRILVDSVTSIGGKQALLLKQPYFNWTLNTNPVGIQPNSEAEYEVENAYEFLDQQGEWYFNKATKILYYIPKSDIANSEVIVPRVEKLMTINGNSNNQKAKNIAFIGIEFRDSTWFVPSERGAVNLQAEKIINAPNLSGSLHSGDIIPSAIEVNFADNIQFSQNMFSNFGTCGIGLLNDVENSLITKNKFEDISATAIVVGTWKNDVNTTEFQVCKNNYIDSNAITKVGQEYMGSTGITGYYTDGLQISHNDIWDIPYSGISVGWGWSAMTSSTTCRNNKILYNRIYDYLKVASDGGGIYTLGQQPSSIIKGNYIRKQNQTAAAIYTDEGTSGYNVTGNVIENAQKYYYATNSYCNNINVSNNYSTTDEFTNNGTNITVADTQIFDVGNKSDTIKGIISKAGIRNDYKNMVQPKSGEYFDQAYLSLTQITAYPGERMTFDLSAYTNLDNPIPLHYANVVWNYNTSVLQLKDNQFLVKAAGTTTITATVSLNIGGVDFGTIISNPITITVSNLPNTNDIADGKPSTASTELSTAYKASYANDNSLQSFWHCGDTSTDLFPWWQVDLQASYKIAFLKLTADQRTNVNFVSTRTNFEVRASNDAGFTSYVVLAKQGAVPFEHLGTWASSVTQNDTYRYIRVVKTVNTGFSIVEFQVYTN